MAFVAPVTRPARFSGVSVSRPSILRVRAPSRYARRSTVAMVSAPTSKDVPTNVSVLDDEVKATIKATVPALKENGLAIVKRFYEIMFERYPSVQKYFNMDRQAKGRTKEDGAPAQAVALANAVLAYARNIDRVEALVPTVTKICHKHVSRAVEPLQYDVVGECLIAAIGEVLGDAATPPIVSAWTQAYGYLAGLFIDIEREVYDTAAAAAGYRGFTQMTVKQVVDGEDGSKVLYVVPDTDKVPAAKQGQYAAIQVSGVPVYVETMLTADINEESDAELRLVVSANGEAANTHLLNTVECGAELMVGMPCGQV